MDKKLTKLIEECNKIDDGPPARYQMIPRKVNLDGNDDTESKLQKCTIGKEKHKQNRTVLLVGETGSGKSTLINALVNFVMGVKFEDNVWFEIIVNEKDRPQTHSQTKEVSVYEVFGFEGVTVPDSLTIIDTPGYGHTKDIEHDDIITHKLQDLFCIPDGVKKIDAVGLVLKASENRLDERLAYVLNSVTSLFDKDMEKNIVVMMTHSDGMEPTNAIQALKEANIKYAKNENNDPVYFLFNNCQNVVKKNTCSLLNCNLSWENMADFFSFLGKRKPQFLETTVKVIKKRIQLTACIQNLEERVTDIEQKQEAIQKNKEELEKHKQNMEENMEFRIEVTETKKEREYIKHWFYKKAVCCTKCEENCHYPGCTLAPNPSWCEVMKNGRCTSCSGKCPVEDHVKEKWRYVTKTEKVKKTIVQMKAKYDQNIVECAKKNTLLEDLEKEMTDLQQNKNQCLDEAFDIIEELEKIALNVNSVSTCMHLEFLIEKFGEKKDTAKVQKLEGMMERIRESDKNAIKYFIMHKLLKKSLQSKYNPLVMRMMK